MVSKYGCKKMPEGEFLHKNKLQATIIIGFGKNPKLDLA